MQSTIGREPDEELPGAPPAAPAAERGGDQQPWRTFTKRLIALLPTANAVVLSIQEFLALKPYGAELPAWVYLAVNGTVVLGTFLAKVTTQLLANSTISQWMEERKSALATPPSEGPGEAVTSEKEVETREAQVPPEAGTDP